jgi:transposase-like protein
VLAQLTKRLVERALEVELTDHLGYEPHAEPLGGAGNTRNGKGRPKTLITENGPVGVRTPRDRDGSFEPQLVRKRQRRFDCSTRRSSRSTRVVSRRARSSGSWESSTASA